MNKSELIKKRDELAVEMYNPDHWDHNFRVGFKDGFDACLELTWSEIERLQRTIDLQMFINDFKKSLERQKFTVKETEYGFSAGKIKDF